MGERMRVLHMQNDLLFVQSQLGKIADQGFTHVKIGPLQPSFRYSNGRNEWYWDYQPLDFTIGNHIGSKEDLLLLTQEAHTYNIQVASDVVIRHLAGQSQHPLFPSEEANPTVTSHRDYWMQPVEHSENVADWRYQMCYRCYGLPAINYNNQEVLDRFIFPLLDETAMLCDGFRIDMAQHFALPSEGSSFWNQVAKRYSNKLVIGECCYLNYEYVLKYSNYCLPHVEDYTNTRWDQALHSCETHDTYLNANGRTRNKDGAVICNIYYDLCRHYAKTEFYARPFSDDWKSVTVKQANLFF